MDIDAMWAQFTKYRPMLDEAFEQWSANKANQEKLQAPRSMDGRVLSEEEVKNDTQAASGRPALGAFVAPGIGAVQPLGAGSHDELVRLREMARAQDVKVDDTWDNARLREELDMEDDDPVYPIGDLTNREPEMIKPGGKGEVDRLREIAEERGVDIDHRWHAKRLREELGFDEDESIPAKAEEAATPVQVPPGEGHTASGTGGSDNPPGHGSTASGTGGMASDPGFGHTASGTGGQDNPPRQTPAKEDNTPRQSSDNQPARDTSESSDRHLQRGGGKSTAPAGGTRRGK
jgi:hypothetical protein